MPAYPISPEEPGIVVLRPGPLCRQCYKRVIVHDAYSKAKADPLSGGGVSAVSRSITSSTATTPFLVHMDLLSTTGIAHCPCTDSVQGGLGTRLPSFAPFVA